MTYRQVLKSIKERDNKDARLERINRARLLKLKLKLKLYQPSRVIIIDTGKVEGVKQVVKEIRAKIKKSDRIFTLEGISGSGKSATADRLSKELGAIRFSFGELFRYLTYLRLVRDIKDLNSSFADLHYRFRDSTLSLWDGSKK